MNYIGNEIRVDGFYYYQFEDGFIETFFLFRNGVYYDYGSCQCPDLEAVENHMMNEFTIENTPKVQYSWGVFRVENNNVEIERWLTGSGGAYPTKLSKGEIINETTMVIKGIPVSGEGTLDTFRFREFSPKPDSTNVFIK